MSEPTTVTLTSEEISDLMEALDYATEDMNHRLRGGIDFADDEASVRATLDRYQKLIEKLYKAARP